MRAHLLAGTAQRQRQRVAGQAAHHPREALRVEADQVLEGEHPCHDAIERAGLAHVDRGLEPLEHIAVELVEQIRHALLHLDGARLAAGREHVGLQRLLDLRHHLGRHRLHADHPLDHLSHRLLAQERQHLGGDLGVHIRQDRGGGLLVLALEIGGDDVFVHRRELGPEVALFHRAADVAQDRLDLLLGQEGAQHCLGRSERADHAAAAVDAFRELGQHHLDQLGLHHAEAGHRAGDLGDVLGCQLAHQLGAALLAQAQKQDRRLFGAAQAAQRRGGGRRRCAHGVLLGIARGRGGHRIHRHPPAKGT